MTLEWSIAPPSPRLHYATHGPWIYVIVPYTTNRFGAWSQRIGWDRDELRICKSLAEAKALLQRRAKQNAGHTCLSPTRAQSECGLQRQPIPS